MRVLRRSIQNLEARKGVDEDEMPGRVLKEMMVNEEIATGARRREGL
jgi:hypothetical protein